MNWLDRKSDRFRFWLGAAFAAIFTVYVLAVLRQTSFISDDAYESQLRGILNLSDMGLLERILKSIQRWCLGAGRLAFVTWWYRYPLFYWVENPKIFKSIGIIFIAVDVVMFGWLVRRITRSVELGLLTCFLLPTLFQFRAWHDPFLAFVFVVPFQMFLLSLSFLTFDRALETKSRVTYALSLGFWWLALGTGEMSYAFTLVPTLIAWLRTGSLRRALVSSLPFWALTLVIFGLMILLKSRWNPYFTDFYGGVRPGVNLAKQWTVFKMQFWAAMPFSYYLRMGVPLRPFWRSLDFWVLAAFSLVSAKLFYSALRRDLNLRALWVVGAAYAVLPVLPLTFSSHYQNEIPAAGWGYGYIPVYLQYGGILLLWMALLLALLRLIPSGTRARTVACLLASLPFSASALVNLGQNRVVALGTRPFYTYPREVIVHALKSGLLGTVPEGGYVLNERRFPSDHASMFGQYLPKRVFVQEPAQLFLPELSEIERNLNKGFLDNYSSLLLSEKDVPRVEVAPGAFWYDTSALSLYAFTYQFDAVAGKNGLAFFAKIERVLFDAEAKAVLSLETRALAVYEYPSGRTRIFPSSVVPFDFTKVFAAKGDAPIPLDALAPARFEAAELFPRWRGECYGLDGTTESNIRWCGPEAELVVLNAGTRASGTTEAQFRTTHPEDADLWIEMPGRSRAQLKISERSRSWRQEVTFPTGRSSFLFRSNARPNDNGDPRKIVFGIQNFSLKKTR